MNRIVIRCDASLSIGSGHVVRCRTLAFALRELGSEVTFICRSQPGDFVNILAAEFPVLSLPEQQLASTDGLYSRDLYDAWLGCSQSDDAIQCLDAIRSAGISDINWIIVDHYGLDFHWEEILLKGLQLDNQYPKLMVIDDLADRNHSCSILLDQNFFSDPTFSRYKNLVPSHCLRLLGPHYCLIAREYSELYSLIPSRKFLKRILVYFGAVDSFNLTSIILTELSKPEFADIAVDVVVGSQSPNFELVKQQVSLRPQTTFYSSLQSLAGLIARADLSIGAGGSTTWERACLGLPSVVITTAANQVAFNKCLAKYGFIKLIWDATVSTANINLEGLSEYFLDLTKNNKSRYLTDGMGAYRVAFSMIKSKGPLRLRLVCPEDIGLLYRWANDPDVRMNSFSPDTISLSEHECWFQDGLLDSNRLHFIALSEANCPIGQIRFDRYTLSDNGIRYEASIDLSLDKSVRGLGYSTQLVSLGLQAMQLSWGSCIDVIAIVMQDNLASNACFSRSGFLEDKVSIPNTISANKPYKCWRWSSSPL